MEIKFSGNYPKLHGQSSAKLLEVHQITIDETTPKELLDYDTTMTDGSKFYLSEGAYLQLILIGNFMIPFCTLRRCTYENVQKYVPNIGKTFELVVKEGNWCKYSALSTSRKISALPAEVSEYPCAPAGPRSVTGSRLKK